MREPRDRRRSSGQSHRGARTDFEPSRPDTQNTFPWFSQTGDVEIVLRDRQRRRRTERYLLHSLILSQNSSVMAQELAAAGHHASAVTVPCRYDLDWAAGDDRGRGETPLLVLKAGEDGQRAQHTRTRSKPPASGGSFFRSLSASISGSSHTRSSSGSGSTSHDDDVLDAYDNLFLIFYNHSPRLDSRELSTAYVQCKLLLALASHYACLPVVAPRVDHHLLRFHRHLWPQVAKYPASYLKLAYTARSRAIFSEALIHVVGQWPSAAGQFRRGDVDGSLVDLIEDKVDDLEELKARVDLKLFRLSLTTSRGERVTPTTSMADWLVVSLFRHWLAEQTAPASQGILKDGAASSSVAGKRRTSGASASVRAAGRAYRQLAAGDGAYLGREELKSFLKLQTGVAYDRDSLKRAERRMGELKHQARDAVKPLTRSFLELDADPRIETAELPYLVCTRVDDRDFDYVWAAADG